MNIEHLRYILEVDRTGSISQAAENLFMGQPNLSKAIKELEKTLNITIFKRNSKGVDTTPKGREFLRYAKGILQQYEEIEALGRQNDETVQELRISVPRASYIVAAFTTFLTKLEDTPLRIDFKETNALRTIRHVTDCRSSLGIIRCRAEYQNYFAKLLNENNLDWQEVLSFRYLLLVSNTHPLAGCDVAAEKDLQPYIEIVHGDTALPYMQNLNETEHDPGLGNKKIYVYERGSQFDLLARVPNTYMWVSPMPEDLLRRNNLKQKQCADSPEFKDLLIFPKGKPHTPLETLFLEELSGSVREIHQEMS